MGSWVRVLVVFLMFAAPARAAEPMLISVVFPGPRNISYLPIDLIPLIGADAAEGAKVTVRHVGGGGVALQEVMSRNADFAVAGLPAAMSLRLRDPGVVVVAAVNDQPLFVLMVSSRLKGIVKTPADLKGRPVGVNTGSLGSKTTSQQLAELVLRNAGVAPEQIRLMAAGQSWEEQSSLLMSGTVDAIMGDEPYATRLLEMGQAFFLANLADPEATRGIPGAAFLHAAVETRREVLEKEPAKVETFVRILRRTLEWMAAHKPAEIVQALGVAGNEEGHHLEKALGGYKRLYSPDGRFSAAQLAETDRFFRATSADDPRLGRFSLGDMIDDRWAGKAP